MKKIIIFVLKILSTMVLRKYKPEVIAITGSVGKTSAKEAISQMLSSKFNIMSSKGNFNNEIGVPLTILGFRRSPNKSIIGWISVCLKSLNKIFKNDKNYPEKLILEMGADHPGDIGYLTNFIPINIGIITKISKVHIEYFKTIEAIAKEKTKIFQNIKKDGWAILNGDDEVLCKYKSQLKCNIMTYGITNEADILATDLQILRQGDFIGMNFKVHYKGNVVPIFLPGALGIPQVYSFLAGIAVSLIYGINLVEISILAKKYFSPRGRTNLIKAINNAFIIDDTYNSSPEALKIAIDLLIEMKQYIHGKKIVVLGDMLELGEDSAELHRDIGEYIWNKKEIDYVFTIGNNTKDLHEVVVSKEFNKNNCVHFNNQQDLIDHLKSVINNDDLVLIKGSQGARMERVVKAIMHDKKLAKDLLVRQDKSWINK